MSGKGMTGQQYALFDLPIAEEPGKERYVREKKHTPDDGPEYGRGLPEVIDWVGGDSDARQRQLFERLTPKKQQGVLAHEAYEKSLKTTSDAIRGHFIASGLPWREFWDQQGRALRKELMSDWKKEWGHIPGWWNIE